MGTVQGMGTVQEMVQEMGTVQEMVLSEQSLQVAVVGAVVLGQQMVTEWLLLEGNEQVTV